MVPTSVTDSFSLESRLSFPEAFRGNWSLVIFSLELSMSLIFSSAASTVALVRTFILTVTPFIPTKVWSGLAVHGPLLQPAGGLQQKREVPRGVAGKVDETLGLATETETGLVRATTTGRYLGLVTSAWTASYQVVSYISLSQKWSEELSD